MSLRDTLNIPLIKINFAKIAVLLILPPKNKLRNIKSRA